MKKEKIVRAAVEIFAEKGFKNTTTAEIKNRAGVAQGTLFYHFKTKEGIIHHILDDTLTLFIQAMEAIPLDELSGLEAIEEFLYRERAFLDEHALEVQVLMREMSAIMVNTPETSPCEDINSPFLSGKLKLLKRFIEKGIRDGSIRTMDADKAAHLILATIFGVSRHMFLHMPTAPDIFPLRNQVILGWLRGDFETTR